MEASMSALWDENATLEEVVCTYQHLINTGDAWKLEGFVGRTAMNLIEDGYCCLGENDHRDYYGNHIPSRYQVEAGTKGSVQFVIDNGNEVME